MARERRACLNLTLHKCRAYQDSARDVNKISGFFDDRIYQMTSTAQSRRVLIAHVRPSESTIYSTQCLLLLYTYVAIHKSSSLPSVLLLPPLRRFSCSLTCFCRVTFSLCVVSKARVIRSVYRFAGDRSLLTALIVGSNNLFACCNLVPSEGELSSSNESRSSCCGGVCGGKAVRVVLVGVFSSMDIRLSSTRPAPRHLARILLVVIVLPLRRYTSLPIQHEKCGLSQVKERRRF